MNLSNKINGEVGLKKGGHYRAVKARSSSILNRICNINPNSNQIYSIYKLPAVFVNQRNAVITISILKYKN